ncbi:MAG: hypothetical protein QN131_00190 [Armatimonadota bacterium]|nr:hypothetical protein [Armatimonadota bacterium]MDR7548344.1 hypothetical protein [Armatimonadota bacterium]
MRRGILLIALGTMLATAAGRASPAPSAATPPEFADLYAALEGRLQVISRAVVARWDGERHPVVFAAELLAANGNRGEQLLTDRAWQGVLVNLDRLQRLGARGIVVKIGYPLLVPTFPRAADYLAFYTRLAQEIRRRNLVLLAKTTAIFRNPVFSAVPVNYAGLTLDRFRREKRQMVETIIREVRPDYLTVDNEPGTEGQNTGLSFTVAAFTEVAQFVTNGLDRRGVRIGAGAGSWDDLTYFQSLAQHTSLDYLDVHIYPVNRDYVADRVFRIAEIARGSGKKVVIGESWLYKSRNSELAGSIAAAADLFARDVFGFWEPLDERFVEVMGVLSHAVKVEFTSFFWSRYFFAYVDYTDWTRRLSPAEVFRLANEAAARNMLADPPRLTQSGVAFQKVSASTAAPAPSPGRW